MIKDCIVVNRNLEPVGYILEGNVILIKTDAVFHVQRTQGHTVEKAKEYLRDLPGISLQEYTSMLIDHFEYKKVYITKGSAS